MTFPEDWPSDCPSADTPDATGEIFRIVKGNPVTAADLRSHHESGKLPKANPCLRCGLSVFLELGDALHQQQLLPQLGNKIAQARLEPMHGKARPTPGRQPTHTTWWPYQEVDRAVIFTVVQELI